MRMKVNETEIAYTAGTSCHTERWKKLTSNRTLSFKEGIWPKRIQDREYRLLMNHEINNLIKEKDIVKFIKAHMVKPCSHERTRVTSKKKYSSRNRQTAD